MEAKDQGAVMANKGSKQATWQLAALALAIGLGAAALFLSSKIDQAGSDQEQLWQAQGSTQATPPSSLPAVAADDPPAAATPTNPHPDQLTPGDPRTLEDHAARIVASFRSFNRQLSADRQIVGPTPGGGGGTDPRAPIDAQPASRKVKKIAFGFFVLTKAKLDATMRTVNASGRYLPDRLARSLMRYWTRAGGPANAQAPIATRPSHSELLVVEGRADPGPGVSLALIANSCEDALPQLFSGPLFLEGVEFENRLKCLASAIERTPEGLQGLSERAALWRAQLFAQAGQPAFTKQEAATKALSDEQKNAVKKAGSGPELQLLSSLHRALEAAHHQQGAIVVMTRTQP